MNRFLAHTVIASALLFCLHFLSAEEPRSLFNGKDLTGWTVLVRGHEPNEDPNGVFSVQDGMLRISGEEFGGISTDEEFSNFHMSLEFKWGEKTFGKRERNARDSGFLFHGSGEPGSYNGTWLKSFEANIVEGGIGDFWLVGGEEDGYKATCVVTEIGEHRIFDPENGSPVTITDHSNGPFRWWGFDPEWQDVKGVRGKNDIAKPGEWTKLEVTVKDGTAEFFVNGILVNRVTELGRGSGKFQLQSEGAEIFYRNITVE